jgi:hypothetical protein
LGINTQPKEGRKDKKELPEKEKKRNIQSFFRTV